VTKRTDQWLAVLQILQWIGLGSGVAFALVSLGFFVNTVIFVERSSVTTGVVVSLEDHQDDDGSVTYSPVFSFVAANGSKQTIHSYSSSNPPGYSVGEQVPVRYETRDPAHARIATYWQTWEMETSFIIASCATSLLGMFFRWRVSKRKNRKPRYQQIQSLDQI
jgi:hypothetical protein